MKWQASKADPHAIIANLIRKIDKPEDAAFARELFFGTIKFKRKVDYFANNFYTSKNLEPKLKQVLRLGFYQLLKADNIPTYAVVSESVELARKFCASRQAGFINAVMRSFLRQPEKVKLPNPEYQPVKYLGLEHSYPDWLVSRYLKKFGYEETEKLLTWGNTPPDLCFYINDRNSSQQEVLKQLDSLNIGFERLDSFDGYYKCLTPHLLLRSKPFESGTIIIGDPAQGLAAKALDVSLGDIVIDLFAAPGGKTASLSGRVGTDGYIIAADNSLKRLKLLKSNIKRWRLDNVFPVCCDTFKFASRRNFKYILADVPCSGTGTIRRNPDLRWNLQEADITRQAKRQARLIKTAVGMLKPGGKLVYSTCSLEPEENNQVVEDFLKQNKGYRLLDLSEHEKFVSQSGFLELIGHRHLSDGAFVALIERK
ncbi:MAG: hypothetical protein GY839_14130 [candidate division Zixibacteria bacterium]|nr:hypothetical protein [candidate division Zixibacteria bacterium]